MKRLFAVVFSCLLCAACGSTNEPRAEQTSTSKREVAEKPAVEYVVLSGAPAEELLRGVLGKEPGKMWEPTEAEVDDLLTALPATASKHISKDLDEYHAQFVGIGESTGKRIFGNFFCDDASKDWKTEPVVVQDGGDCFFQVSYDPDTGDFGGFFVNGEA